MMLKRMIGVWLVLTMSLVGFFLSSEEAIAVGNQSHQGINRSATLTAPSPNFEISLYPKPDPKLDRLGYGLSGDTVTILEQMGSNQGYAWYRVKFDGSPPVEGWIRGDYLVFIHQDSQTSPPIPDKNRYLGNRSSQSNRQNNQRQYNR